MPFTGRHSSGKLSRSKGSVPPGGGTGHETVRAARVAELRRLVAAGRYHVEPRKLAISILNRALAHGKR